MALILNIETSTENCSVSVAKDGVILSLKEEYSDKYIHSESLHPFIREVLDESGHALKDLQAVAVGKGPGSYTGLRIGVSAAKGLAFPLDIPLISASSLEILVAQFKVIQQPGTADLLIPMIDARRMEVYTAVFSHNGTPISMIESRIIENRSLSHLQGEKIWVFGTGAAKCREVLNEEKFVFEDPVYPSASGLATISEEKFRKNRFEDTAYFEPFYLKEFIAGKPKPLL